MTYKMELYSQSSCWMISHYNRNSVWSFATTLLNFLRRKFFRYFSNFQLPRFDSQERWLFLIRGLCVSSCIFSGFPRKLSVNSGWQNRIFIQKNRLHFPAFLSKININSTFWHVSSTHTVYSDFISVVSILLPLLLGRSSSWLCLSISPTSDKALFCPLKLASIALSLSAVLALFVLLRRQHLRISLNSLRKLSFR